MPKAPEELYDLRNDPEEVRNLAASPEHRAVLERLRQALREHILLVRDVCFLPESELHSRSEGATPYEMARDDAKYPLKRILAAAELASGLDPAALPGLARLLADPDSAVRYWAALGYLMRGQAAVTQGQAPLRKALKDASTSVRIVAAQALGQFGGAEDRAAALIVLRDLAPPEKNGVLTSMSALAAIEALGAEAASLHEFVSHLKPDGPSPDGRYNSYVPRLIQNIVPGAGAAEGKTRNKGKGKKK